MAELSKQALKVENNTEFPNNNNGQITPSRLRTFNEDMIDSLVDEITYNADSASWNAQIQALDPSGSAESIAALNAFTSSQLVINSGINSFTQSADGRLDSLEAATSSYATSAITASSLVTASFDNGTRNLTFTKGDSSTFAVNIPDVSGSSGNFVTTSSFNAYTASNDQRVSSLEANSASVNISITNLNSTTASLNSSITQLNASSASQQVSINALNTNSASVNTSITNINSTTASLNTSASLAVVTASFDNGTRNLTFTKGDTTQFSVNIPDVSGSAGNFVTTSSFNAFTESIDQRVDSLEAATSSYVTSAITASSLITASAAGSTITFTKGDASTFNVTLDTGSATSTTTIYETVYTGEAITKGDPLYISGSQGANPIVYKADASIPAKMPVTYIASETIGAGTTSLGIVLGLIEGMDLTGYDAGNAVYVAEGGGWTTNLPSGSNSITQLLGVVTKGGSGGKGLVLNPGPAQLPGLDSGYLWAGDANNQPTQVTTASFASTGSNTFNGNQIVNGFVSASGDLYGANVRVGDTGNLRFLSGSSYYNIQLVPGTGGDLAFSRDGDSNVKTFVLGGAAGNVTSFQNNAVSITDTVPSFNVSAASTSISGSGSYTLSAASIVESAVTATMTATSSVIGTFSVTGQSAGDGKSIMLGHSGSLVLTNSATTPTYSSLNHISSSAANANTNLIFKTNTNTADTIVSSSANIFTNPSAPTAGFKRYMTGGNLAIGGTGAAVPQISGSMAWSPIIANNVFAVSSNPLTFRGPVSSSQSLLNNNVFAGGQLNLGSSATNNFERAINGTTFNNNILNGTLNATAFKTAFVGTAAMSIASNNVGGTLALNADSSSISFANNTFQSVTTINNSYFNPSVTTGAGNGLTIAGGNGVFGASHNIYASGSNTSTTIPRLVQSNFIAGYVVSASVNLNGDNSNLIATSIMGHGLNVTGSSGLITAPTKYNGVGSMFVGRHNAQDGNRARTAETVFAVGTGTSTADKTGFLIDSGSNTFVEGTFNMSGSSAFNGDVDITGSLVANKLSCYDFDSIYYGSQMGGTTANGTFFGYGSTSYSWIMGAYAGGFDNELQFQTDSTGIYFNDFNGSGYNNFLKLLPNSGTNPSPIMTRGLIVTGSLGVSGSITATTLGTQGTVITNATPVSSSLQPTLNIVTMTSAEYALITPNSQTLYVIV